MAKITFKNPKGGTLYKAKVGFDWGAFWGFFILGGLPFFLRKMNIWGAFCLVFMLSMGIYFGLETVSSAINASNPEKPTDFEEWRTFIFELIPFLLISFYLGIKGGKLTARHYLEEGYEVLTKDEALLTRAKSKWDLEI
jgi:hypothetical protein